MLPLADVTVVSLSGRAGTELGHQLPPGDVKGLIAFQKALPSQHGWVLDRKGRTNTEALV